MTPIAMNLVAKLDVDQHSLSIAVTRFLPYNLNFSHYLSGWFGGLIIDHIGND